MATITYSYESVVGEFVVNATTAEGEFDSDPALLSGGTSFGRAA